jgi:hypothetical protein
LVPRPRAGGAHAQSPTEPPALATMEGGQGTSRPPSPFFFSSSATGDFFHKLAFSYLGILVLALIRVHFFLFLLLPSSRGAVLGDIPG